MKLSNMNELTVVDYTCLEKLQSNDRNEITQTKTNVRIKWDQTGQECSIALIIRNFYMLKG